MDPIAIFARLSPAEQADALARHFGAQARQLRRVDAAAPSLYRTYALGGRSSDGVHLDLVDGAASPAETLPASADEAEEDQMPVEEVFVPEEAPAPEEFVEPVVEAPAEDYSPLLVALGLQEPQLPEDPGANYGEIGSGSKRREARAGSPVLHRWRELSVFSGAKLLDTDQALRRLHAGAGRERTLAVRAVLQRNLYEPIAVTEIVRQIAESHELRAAFERWEQPSVLEFHVFWILDRLATIGAVAVRHA